MSGSIWHGRPDLVDELALGVVDGASEYMFGRVGQIAPDGRGGAYVVDEQVPALRGLAACSPPARCTWTQQTISTHALRPA